MAITKLSDVVSAANMSAFLAFFNKAYHDNSAFLKSGIAATDPAIQSRIAEAGVGGYLVKMPFWGDLDGEEEKLVDAGSGGADTSLTVSKIAANQDVAVITRRAKAFGITDLAVDLAGDDPMGWIASRLGAYWARRDEAKLLATLKGIFTASTGAGKDNMIDLSGAALGKTTILTAAQVLGDRKTELVGIAMHSAVEAALAGLDVSSTLYKPSEGGTLSSYCGKSLVMDDNLRYNPESTTKDGLAAGCAEIYLFGRGAVALADAKEKTPFEAGRDPLKNGGEEYVVSRHANIAHLRGIKYKGTDSNPDNTVLATAANWEKVYNTKDIRVVKAIVKIA